MARQRKDRPAPRASTGSVPGDQVAGEFEALLAAIRQSIRGTDLTLAVHRTLAELRVSQGEQRVTAWLLPEGSVMMVVKTTGQMTMSHPGPVKAEDVEPWARKLAEFMTRRLRE
ncbi:MAG: hypothetical protein ABIK09_09080 [Pseudomonadota bacterium]